MSYFDNAKAITIAGKAVKKLELAGKTIWEGRAFTNLVLTSTTDPGGTAIYNGKGWYDGLRWSSSGGKPSSEPAGRLTGWMPFKAGATIRLKNFGLTRSGYVSGCYFVWYKSNGTTSTVSTGAQSVDELTYTAPNDSSIRYFRISAFCFYTENEVSTAVPTPPIVTINEEIPQ